MRFSVILAAAAIAALSLPASAKPSFTNLHSFCQQANCTDGANPHFASPYVFANGDIVGTTEKGGDTNTGTVWMLKKNGGSYSFSRIYSFCSDPPVCTDGGNPVGQFIEDKDGNLYGVAGYGSRIYKLTPNGDHSHWTESVVYSFTDVSKGFSPGAGLAYQGQAEGELWDGKSPLYGSTLIGGPAFQGVVYRLNPKAGTWTQDVLYNFCSKTDCVDGGDPTYVRLLVDKKGKTLTGTASRGGTGGFGVLYRLTGGKKGWKYSVLYNFCTVEPLCADGRGPNSGVVADKDGNLYGTTLSTSLDGGIVYKIAPGKKKAKYTQLYHYCQTDCSDGNSIWAGPAIDARGNLYTVSLDAGLGGSGGTVMALTKKGKKYKPGLLYQFCQDASCTDGKHPWTNVVRGADGTLFGMTNEGGANGSGVVFAIKP
ncbi:MAG TPA: choice-of-anchor tandem repeat GloVer-containing protein [Rhizomicrobium sp.]|nr:choice-of-anchor tandem repeat GloVer-containing protein [Rhizomicrobium sp.]